MPLRVVYTRVSRFHQSFDRGVSPFSQQSANLRYTPHLFFALETHMYRIVVFYFTSLIISERIFLASSFVIISELTRVFTALIFAASVLTFVCFTDAFSGSLIVQSGLNSIVYFSGRFSPFNWFRMDISRDNCGFMFRV